MTDHKQIRKRFTKLAFQYHPDRNPWDAHALQKFKEAVDAYEFLTEICERAAAKNLLGLSINMIWRLHAAELFEGQVGEGG